MKYFAIFCQLFLVLPIGVVGAINIGGYHPGEHLLAWVIGCVVALAIGVSAAVSTLMMTRND